MSESSPLFISAIELIAHGTELYTQANPKKYKFIVLHLANAIELILKDKIIDLGHSIYKDKGSQTIGIWESFKILEASKINILEKPVIELIVDDRNTIQHRFGFPNAESVFYYLQQTVLFFTRFLNEHYGVDLYEVLRAHTSAKNLQIIGLKKEEDSELESIDELFKIAPESAVLRAWSILEKRLSPYLLDESVKKNKRPVMIWHHKNFNTLLSQLQSEKLVDGNVFDDFATLRDMRNRAAHSQHYDNISIESWKNAVEIGKKIILAITKAEKNKLLYFQQDEDNKDI